MKFFFVLVFVCCLSVFARAEFISNTDIPLMENMVVDDNESFSFDSPAGQIMLITGKTKTSERDILAFYEASLAELGWQKKSATHYVRDQDDLVLQVISGSKESVVKIQFTFANK